jgi:anti-anti-sigma factor
MAGELDRFENVVTASPFLRVGVRRDAHRLEVSLVGEVDLAASEGLDPVFQFVDAFLRSDGQRPVVVVVDMAEVSFCDGSGVAFLVGMQGKTVNAGGRFAVRNASPVVRRLLGILELRGLLDGEDA